MILPHRNKKLIKHQIYSLTTDRFLFDLFSRMES
ncbi:unnamed protein product [Tenebrio molitor]|nr:unnamed protein product [Tenebrio molitor]